MDLKCLIKLLLEKGVIIEKITHYDLNGNVVVKEFSYEFDEVLKKIKESQYDKENIIIDIGNHGHCFFIANKNHLREYLLKLDYVTRFQVDTQDVCHSIIMPRTLTNIFKNDNDIKLDKTVSGHRLKITNLRKLRKKEEEKRKRKNEVLDFLDQLP